MDVHPALGTGAAAITTTGGGGMATTGPVPTPGIYTGPPACSQGTVAGFATSFTARGVPPPTADRFAHRSCEDSDPHQLLGNKTSITAGG